MQTRESDMRAREVADRTGAPAGAGSSPRRVVAARSRTPGRGGDRGRAAPGVGGLPDRRAFLRTLGRLAVGAAAIPVAPRLASAWPALPPPTIGLRSLGGSFVFDPPGLLVGAGRRVHWLNIGDFHTVSAFHPANADLLPGQVPLRMPEAAEPFHSGMLGLDAGSHFSRRFPVEGVYDYFCQPHYTFGMVARLVVGRARDGPAVRRPVTELVEAAREALPRVAAITGAPGSGYLWSARLNGVLLLAAGERGGVEAPSGAPAAAVRTAADAAERDRRLLQLLDRAGARRAFVEALGSLAESVAQAPYEELVSLVDAAKEPLEEAIAAAGSPGES